MCYFYHSLEQVDLEEELAVLESIYVTELEVERDERLVY